MALPPATQPTTILYIEDNPDNRMLARAVLGAEGYRIIEAVDGLSGIETALRERPALILLDINIPGVDGYEVAGILKSFPALAQTPVVAVTAYAMEGDRQRTLVAGCDGYIPKPIDVDAFPGQVAEFLDGKRERVDGREESVYLRDLNQRLVYRMLHQVEELQRLNEHFMRRANQLEDLHGAVQGITSELGIEPLLQRLLPGLLRGLGASSLTVELTDPAGVRVTVTGETTGARSSVLAGADSDPGEDWTDVEWTVPVSVHGRTLGSMMARKVSPPGTKADEANMLKIVANQVAIAVENSRLYDGVVQRMAELKETQAQLVHAAKLAAIGELAANVAHELNNPLTAVLGFSEYLAERAEAGTPTHKKLNLIHTEARRACEIVRDLLQFSRRREFAPTRLELNALVAETVALVRSQGAAREITIGEHYAETLPEVCVDGSRMKQVFLNLINNAIHAMPEGGSLTVRTAAAADGVHVEFADTGTGIRPEHLERIFEPFFTTKPDSRGTGLGLSVSLGLVQSHGGTIEVKSELGLGTSFVVKLPRAAADCASADVPTPLAAPSGPARTEPVGV